MAYLSEDEVFGTSKYLDPSEVFGDPGAGAGRGSVNPKRDDIVAAQPGIIASTVNSVKNWSDNVFADSRANPDTPDYRPTSDVGGGRGFVNPDNAITPESVDTTETILRNAASLAKIPLTASIGLGQTFNQTSAVLSKLAGAHEWASQAEDRAKQLSNENLSDFVDNPTLVDRVSHSMGNALGMIAESVLSAGESAAVPVTQTVMQAVGDMGSHAFRAAIIPGLTSAAETMQQVYDKTGDKVQAFNAGLASYAGTTTMFLAPVAMSGGKIANTLSGGFVQPIASEASKSVSNLGLPEDMRQPVDLTTAYTPESIAAGMVFGGLMGGGKQPKAPDRIDLGYAPFTEKTGTAAGIDQAFNTGTVHPWGESAKLPDTLNLTHESPASLPTVFADGLERDYQFGKSSKPLLTPNTQTGVPDLDIGKTNQTLEQLLASLPKPNKPAASPEAVLTSGEPLGTGTSVTPDLDAPLRTAGVDAARGLEPGSVPDVPRVGTDAARPVVDDVGTSSQLPERVPAKALTDASQLEKPDGITPEKAVPQESRPETQPIADAAKSTAGDRISDSNEAANRAALTPVSQRTELDAPPDVIERQMEEEYQQSIKDDIRERLGLIAPPVEAAPPPSVFRSFLREFGIHKDHAQGVTGETGIRPYQRLLNTFRSDGLHLDELAQRAQERGWLSPDDIANPEDNGGTRKLTEMIQDEINGKRQVSSEFAQETAEAAAERRHRAEIENMADKLGLPYAGDIDIGKLESMVNRVNTRLENPRPTDQFLKPERVRQNAIETALRIEKKRAEYESRNDAFAQENVRVQDAVLQHFFDENGNPVIHRKSEADAQSAWHDLTGQQDETHTPEYPLARQSQTLDIGRAETGTGDHQADGASAQHGSDEVPRAAAQGEEAVAPKIDSAEFRKLDEATGLVRAAKINVDAVQKDLDQWKAWQQSNPNDRARETSDNIARVTKELDQANQAHEKALQRQIEAQAAVDALPALDDPRNQQDLLVAPTREDVLTQQERAEQVAKDQAKADADAEKKAKAEREAKEIADRQAASAKNFQLGQSAEDGLAGQGSIFDIPAESKPAEHAEEKPATKTEDTGSDIPPRYFKNTKVDHEVWIEDENKSDTMKVTAKEALDSLKEDISNYEKLLNCMSV